MRGISIHAQMHERIHTQPHTHTHTQKHEYIGKAVCTLELIESPREGPLKVLLLQCLQGFHVKGVSVCLQSGWREMLEKHLLLE